MSKSYRVKSITAAWEHQAAAPSFKSSFIKLGSPLKMIHGYVRGHQQFGCYLELGLTDYKNEQLVNLQLALKHYFPEIKGQFFLQNDTDVINVFGSLLCALQHNANHPIFEPIDIISMNDKNIRIWVATLNEICLSQIANFLVNVFNKHATVTTFTSCYDLTQQKNALLEFLRACAPQGSNCYRFLKAAYDAHIAWTFIGVNSFQFGYGAASRWLDSSITDETSQIGSKLTRDKFHAAALMQQAGFPTPQKYFVSNESEAIRMANTIGYPVVLKPDNQDGGDGVTANIFTEHCLRKAYQYARKYSPHVLLEKHIVGKDYRLVVLNGKLIWAIERIPAGVFGDGIHTIDELIHLENQKSPRTRELFPVKKLELNSEALDYLAENNWQTTSIPEREVFVPLCRIANISRGGTAVGVFHKVHPDNKRLAETVTKLYRLDLAGVDLIVPDISKSYLATGGTIIEVNAQPQLGMSTAPHIYHEILTTLLPHQGRIPILVIFGKDEEGLLQELQTKKLSEYQYIGIARNQKATINGHLVTKASSLLQAGKALLSLKEVQAMIYCIHDMTEVDDGLPFDRYDDLYSLEEVSVETLEKACTGQMFNLAKNESSTI